jgi:hypothetical protein
LVLEGSSDGSEWIPLDERADDQTLTEQGEFPIGKFEVANPAQVRLIRIKETDTNHSGDYHISLSTVEFFGVLVAAPV